jgi:hypothetical protein
VGDGAKRMRGGRDSTSLPTLGKRRRMSSPSSSEEEGAAAAAAAAAEADVV